MQSLFKTLCRFLVREDGPTAVEYAVMISFIMLVCFAAVVTVGAKTASVFSNAANSIH